MSTRRIIVKYALFIALVAGLLQVVSFGLLPVRAEESVAQLAYIISQNDPGSGWQYHRAITIDNSGGSTMLSNYQVKVSLTSANFDFSHSQSNGQDLRIMDSDDVTLLSYWLESYNAAAQTATLWVKVPSVPANATKTIYLYYGNSTASAASNGSTTFDFFDNFDLTATGYYTLSAPTTVVLGSAQSWETSPIHTLSVIPLNSGGYQYWGYYGLQGSNGNVGLVRSNDLVNWVKYPTNPLFAAAEDARWPSAVLQSGTLYLVYNQYYATNPRVVLRTSTDGLAFTAPQVVVPDVNYHRIGNPSLFYNPNDSRFYLYWYDQDTTVTPNVYTVFVKNASTAADLASAPSTLLLTSTTTLAAPNMMFADNTYFLSTETYETGIWKTRIWNGLTPTGPFTQLPGNPILGNGSACFFQQIFGTTMHAWSCKLTGSTWTLEHRTADLTAGRPQIPYLDTTKWTPGGNETWSVQSASQQNGTTGFVAQLVGDPNRTGPQILRAAYTGNDYILEGYGQLLSGRVWGLGARAANQDNLYTANLYEDLDGTNNLYLYRWLNDSATTLTRTPVGPINLNTWYKFGLKVVGSSIQAYLNDTLQLQGTDTQFASGYAALTGEAGTTARFNDVRIRKSATIEPTTSVGAMLLNQVALTVNRIFTAATESLKTLKVVGVAPSVSTR